MSGRLHQLNMEYQAAEDRLLLKVNTTDKQEFRMWLTRRFTGQFWDALVRILEQKPEIRGQADPDVKKAMIALTQERTLRREQFEKRFVDDARSFPLGDAPVLLTGFSYAPGGSAPRASDASADAWGDASGDTTGAASGPAAGPRMAFQTARGSEIGLVVNDQILFSLARLLSQVVAQTGWGYSFDLGTGTDGAGRPGSLRLH